MVLYIVGGAKMNKKLYKVNEGKMISGVCMGLAEYFDFDVSLVRIITVLLVFSGVSPFLYLILAIILPVKEV